VSLVIVLTVYIVLHKSSPLYSLDSIVLTLNQVCGVKFYVFTGSPIHPPSRCSQQAALFSCQVSQWRGEVNAVTSVLSTEERASG
jgi:hypothetical protein